MVLAVPRRASRSAMHVVVAFAKGQLIADGKSTTLVLMQCNPAEADCHRVDEDSNPRDSRLGSIARSKLHIHG